MLVDGGVVEADLLELADEVADLRALVDAEAAVTSALVPIGAGALLIARAS